MIGWHKACRLVRNAGLILALAGLLWVAVIVTVIDLVERVT